MTFIFDVQADMWVGLVFGAIFGFILHRARVTSYDVIVNQFRLRDFTVMRVMLSAIIVGGIGVLILHSAGLSQYHIKSADLLAVTIGAALFGVGMVLYGYCPGTGVAAIGAGSIHALVGAIGMVIGGVAYALMFPWIKSNVLPVWSLGKVRLPDVTGISDPVWFLVIVIGALGLFRALDRQEIR